MKINKIDHICIAVKNIEQAMKIWGPVLGREKPDNEYEDKSEQIKVVRYCFANVGLELMESLTQDGPVAKFIEKNGEGIMVLSLNVDNTRESIEELKKQEYPFIGEPRPFNNCEFAFIHPSKMNGVLLELIDDNGTALENEKKLSDSSSGC
jgi:methylmalonyl-CoA/ethylmalonyl-CoA epimerase